MKLYRVEQVGPAWERRIVANGYVQHREVYPDGRRGEWQFYVSGFSYQKYGRCTVLKQNNTYDADVKIDAGDRIFINGRWHGPRYWDH